MCVACIVAQTQERAFNPWIVSKLFFKDGQDGLVGIRGNSVRRRKGPWAEVIRADGRGPIKRPISDLCTRHAGSVQGKRREGYVSCCWYFAWMEMSVMESSRAPKRHEVCCDFALWDFCPWVRTNGPPEIGTPASSCLRLVLFWESIEAPAILRLRRSLSDK
jgi:hypothetical protein